MITSPPATTYRPTSQHKIFFFAVRYVVRHRRVSACPALGAVLAGAANLV
jgi:hypothetical protein